MMVDDDDHRARVDDLLRRAARGASKERLIEVFERGFAALWGRAHQTLGDVTLRAIVDRVLYVSAEKHPILSALRLEGDGLRCEELRARAACVSEGALTEAVRFVLVELLSILGTLTSGIITPGLHSALANAVCGELGQSAAGGDETSSSASEGEEPEP